MIRNKRGGGSLITYIILGLLIFSAYQIFFAAEPWGYYATIKEQFKTKPAVVNTQPDTNNPQQTSTPKETEPVVTNPPGNFNFEVDFIDVGQGDATLVRYPSGINILIDGGGKYKGIDVVNYLESQGITELDTIVATHNDIDHIGGLSTVMNYFPVKKFLHVNQSCDTIACIELMKTVVKNNLTDILANSGLFFYVDNQTRTQIFNPGTTLVGDDNANSIVLKISYKSTSFLLTGDCTDVCEDKMLNAMKNVDSDVLKVGHHGSNASTSQKFLDKVTPSYAVISVGKNNAYGFPKIDVLQRLMDMKTYRTDELGTIVFKSDGEKIEVNI
jgi:competence protein ComEC